MQAEVAEADAAVDGPLQLEQRKVRGVLQGSGQGTDTGRIYIWGAVLGAFMPGHSEGILKGPEGSF